MDGRPERKKSRVSHNPRHNERDRNHKRQDKRHTEPSGRCHMSGLEGSSARRLAEKEGEHLQTTATWQLRGALEEAASAG